MLLTPLASVAALGHGQTSLTATLDLSSVFDEDAEEAFDGAHGGAMQHHRNVLLTPLASMAAAHFGLLKSRNSL